VYLHDGGHGWGGSFDITAGPTWTVGYIRKHLFAIHGPLPRRLLLYDICNQPISSDIRMSDLLAKQTANSITTRTILIQAIYVGSFKHPAEFNQVTKLPAEFRHGVCDAGIFLSNDPPFQVRQNLPHTADGTVIITMELQLWMDGTTTQGKSIFSGKGRLVDRGGLVNTARRTAPFPILIVLSPEVEVLTNQWFDAKRQHIMDDLVTALQSLEFKTPSGQRYFMGILFNLLIGDGKALAAGHGLTRGHSQYSCTCIFCTAGYGMTVNICTQLLYDYVYIYIYIYICIYNNINNT
jgi:hypothetical protein